jgi:hypothetical protein
VTGLGTVGAFTFQTIPGSLSVNDHDIAVGPSGQALVVGERNQDDPPRIDAWFDVDGLGPGGFGNAATVTNIVGYPARSFPETSFGTDGRAYLVYDETKFGSQSRDVYLRYRGTGDSNWNAAIRVNSDVDAVARVLPHLAVDGASGALGVAWYDSRAGINTAQVFGRIFPTVVRPPEPGSPVNLRAQGVSRSQIDMTWEDHSDNETGFEVRRTSGSPFAPVIKTFVVPAGTTSFSDTGLPEDTGFLYHVRAFNNSGFSTPTNAAGATTLDSPPSAPTNLVATGISFQRIDLSWSPSDDPDGYEIQQSKDAVNWVSLGRSATTGTNAMLFGLDQDMVYYFRVRAFNSGGDSPFSNIASARTAPSEPRSPSALTATAVSRSQINLAWTDESTNELRFEIERSTNNGSLRVVGSVGANVTAFADTRLKAGTTYSYRVRACNEIGCSLPSNTAVATTVPR